MKFSVSSTGFISAVSFATEISQKCALRDYEDVNKITISSSKDKMVISAFNGRIAIESEASNILYSDLQYNFENEGNVTVNSKDLANVLDSFDKNESLVFELKKENNIEELVISKSNDTEQFQTLTVYPSEVKLPQKAQKFIKELTIGKDILIDAVSKISFAFGYENNRQRYLRWQIRADDDKIRFISGTGSLFACLDKIGNKINKSAPEVEFFIPVEHTPLLVKILSLITDDSITIKESDPKEKKTPHQIVIKTSLGEMILVGMTEGLAWIDENSFLGLDYSHKFITKISDWVGPIKGILATFNEDFKKSNKTHAATFEADISRKVVLVKASENMKSLRKVPLLDSQCGSKNNNPKFICPSTYLATTEQNAPDKDGYVQIEFMDGQKKPVVMVHYSGTKVQDREKAKKNDDISKISERFIVFFATLAG
jgi:hypothetical protein